jgi:NlpC/P60 family putative phage cell wall peptidase
MPVTRSAVVAAARRWIGTPFAHQGRVKGRAVDCLGLILCVLEEVGAMGASPTSESWTRLPEYTQYGPEPGKGKVYAGCIKHAILKPFHEVKAGDILSLRAPSEPCHVAFVSKQGTTLYMIHAYNGGKQMCVEHVLDEIWLRRIAGVFEIPDIED